MDRRLTDWWDEGAMSVEQVGEEFSLGRTTLFVLLAEGKLVSSKVGRRRIISRKSLKALLAENQFGGGEV